MAQRGLGAGLGALFGDDALDISAGDGAPASTLPIARIEPRKGQPRTVFDEEALEELASSIREHGLIQPITVRPLGDGWYQIIAGERRWRASKLAGLSEVPVRIVEADDRKASELALVENLQREDLNPVEEALGYRSLMDDYDLTQESVSERVGKSRPVIANALRLLSLPESVLRLVADGTLSLSLARTLLVLNDPADQEDVAADIVEKGLTVRQAAALVKKRGARRRSPKSSRLGPDGVDYLDDMAQDLMRYMARKVRITGNGKTGKVILDYYDADDFEFLTEELFRIRPEKMIKGKQKKERK